MRSQIGAGFEDRRNDVLGFCQNRRMPVDDYDDVYNRGIMNMSDAARYLAVSQQTFHRWARGYERGEPLLHLAHTQPSNVVLWTTSYKGRRDAVAAANERGEVATVGDTSLAVLHDAVIVTRGRRTASVSFTSLTEAYVLQALRTAGVLVRKIRPALRVLQKEFGTEYALTAPNLATDGIDVLWDFSKTPGGAGLIEARTGQTVIRAIVADYLTYISREDDGRPTRLQLQSCEPAKVIVDPMYGFGQPRFGASGARLADVAAMLKAGETAEVVADEFGISTHEVGTAARVLLGRSA